MTRDELARAIYDVSHITGKFLLRSGIRSTEYFDKYLFESNPVLLSAIAQEMVKLIPPATEVLAGLETGGIPIATALSLQTLLPVVFVRREAKQYGTAKLVEGILVEGRKLCVFEDVVTTGGRIIESTSRLRELGATITNILCIIERESQAKDNLSENGLSLASLFTMAELKRLAGNRSN